MLAKARRPSWTSRLADRSRTSWSGQGAFLYSPKRAGLPGHPGQPTVPGHPGRAEKPKQKKTDHPLLAKTSRPSRTSRLANRSRTSWSGQGAFLYSPKRAGLPGHPGQPTVPGHPGRAEKPKQKTLTTLCSPKRAGLPGHPGWPTIPGHPGQVEMVARRKRNVDHRSVDASRT